MVESFAVQAREEKGLSKLVLGTAQIGMKYGVANRLGQPLQSEVDDIVACAYEHGLRKIDTAAGYGNSESALGRAGVEKWSIITKVSSLREINHQQVYDTVRSSIMHSLERLRVNRLYAALAHDPADLIGRRGEFFLSAMQDLKREGLLEKFGVSVYDPTNLWKIADGCKLDVVQAPANVFDQRFLRSGHAKLLCQSGVEFHTRSAFLQGLLLMAPAERPRYFARWRAQFDEFDRCVRNSGMDRLAFCLGFVNQRPEISNCIVGIERLEQLNQIIEAYQIGMRASPNAVNLWSSDLELIDPRRWETPE